MGYILLNTVSFTPTPTTNQIVTVEYKLDGASSYTLFSNNLLVLVNGTFSPQETITGLADNTLYNVLTTPNCGGAANLRNVYTGVTNATTTTTTAPITTTTTTFLGAEPCTLWDLTGGTLGTTWRYKPCNSETITDIVLASAESVNGICAQNTYDMNKISGNGTRGNVGPCV